MRVLIQRRMSSQASLLGLPTELRLQSYRHVTEIPETSVVLACCKDHAKTQVIKPGQHLWQDSQQFWNAMAEVGKIMRVSKTITAEVSALLFPHWQMCFCLRHDQSYEVGISFLVTQYDNLATSKWSMSWPLSAWIGWTQHIRLRVNFLVIKPLDIAAHRQQWETIDLVRWFLRHLNEAKKVTTVRIDIYLTNEAWDRDEQEQEEYIRIRLNELATFLCVLEHLDDGIELELWIGSMRDLNDGETRDALCVLDDAETGTIVNYINELRSKKRTKHSRRQERWMLDEWNKLLSWVDRAFAFKELSVADELDGFHPGCIDLECRFETRVYKLLQIAWQAHHHGHEVAFQEVKEKFKDLLKEYQQEMVDMLDDAY